MVLIERCYSNSYNSFLEYDRTCCIIRIIPLKLYYGSLKVWFEWCDWCDWSCAAVNLHFSLISRGTIRMTQLQPHLSCGFHDFCVNAFPAAHFQSHHSNRTLTVPFDVIKAFIKIKSYRLILNACTLWYLSYRFSMTESFQYSDLF